jgi:flagellar protein FlaG
MATSEISGLSLGRAPTSVGGDRKASSTRGASAGTAESVVSGAASQDAAGSEPALATPKMGDDDVGRLNSLIQQIRRELRFSVDESTGRTIIRVINTQTNEIVRQIPPEEVVSLMQHLRAEGRSLMMEVEA